jgi:hypothetical protein
MHLQNRLPSPLRIASGLGGILGGHIGIPVLEVGEIDIYNSIELLQYLYPFPSTSVIDKRNPQPSPGCDIECQQNVWRVMSRSYDIDVVTAALLKLQHHIGEVFDVPFLPSPSLTDLPIDAEHTSQPTIRKEDRSRTFVTSKGALLSMVGTEC